MPCLRQSVSIQPAEGGDDDVKDHPLDDVDSPRKEWCEARLIQIRKWAAGDIEKAMARLVGLESLLHERDGLSFISDAPREDVVPGVPQFDLVNLGHMVETFLGRVWLMTVINSHNSVIPVAFSEDQAKEIHRRLHEALS